jgi:pyridoxal 5'-phosphate synthase pdxS subunit
LCLTQILMEVSTDLGPAMVGINDLKSDPVNFRDREGGSEADHVPKKMKLTGATETQLYGSSWQAGRQH